MVKKLANAVKQAVSHGRVPTGESTGPVGLRERKKSRTRDAIVEAALDLFEQKGYEATTVEEIAEAADISPRTFFRYFDSKDDVVMPGKEREAHEPDLEAELTARAADVGAVAAIHQLFRDEAARAIDEDPLFLRQFRLTMQTPSLKTRVLDHFQEHQDQFRRLFAAQLGVGEDALQAHLRAAAVGTTMWTVIDRWVAEGARTERLLPMLDEGFTLLAAGMDRA